jgi:predicted nucleic acid-binding protein
MSLHGLISSLRPKSGQRRSRFLKLTSGYRSCLLEEKGQSYLKNLSGWLLPSTTASLSLTKRQHVPAANLTAHRQKKRRAGEVRDTMIAGIVLARHASLATRNVTHFADISATVVNPWVA